MLRPEFSVVTDRLVLRPFTSDDVDDVWAYQRQPEVARHMMWAARDREQTRLVVAQMAGEVALRKDGDCLSMAVLWPEAVRELLRLGFDELGLHRVIGRCAALNTASARLLERLGMRRKAHFVDGMVVKGEWREELVYATLEHEWRARRSRGTAGMP